MPIIKSAIKRMRQSAKQNQRNVQTKRKVKVATKDLQAAIIAKDSKKANDLLKTVQSTIDTAAKKNVIHKNKASRLKSQYSAKVKALGGPKTTVKKASSSKSVVKKASTTTKATTKTNSTTKKSVTKKASKSTPPKAAKK